MTESSLHLGIVDLINEVNELTDDGLVALAHPSSITIGYLGKLLSSFSQNMTSLFYFHCSGNTHGVYVLPDYYSRKGKNCWLSPCLEVLQKPSYSTMIEREAMFNSCKTNSFNYGSYNLSDQFLSRW